MRTPNDIKLAEGCTDIDLILGGHDHVYEVLEVSVENTLYYYIEIWTAEYESRIAV